MFYPHFFHKTDKLGRPVYIEILGDLKIDEMFKITTPERLIQYQVKLYESLLNSIFPICTQNAKKYVQQTFTIIDLKKLSSKLLSKKVYNFLKLTSSNSQNNYPEMLGQLFFVNTGLMFKAAWSVIKAFVDDKTKKKIITVGSDYKKKLLEHIDACNLPKILGGECVCEPYGCVYANAGPWNKEGKIESLPNPELLKMKESLANEEPEENVEENTEVGELNLEGDDDDEDDDRAKLDELSKQLKENMNINNETNNIKFRLEKNENDDGETPINTQEV